MSFNMCILFFEKYSVYVNMCKLVYKYSIFIHLFTDFTWSIAIEYYCLYFYIILLSFIYMCIKYCIVYNIIFYVYILKNCKHVTLSLLLFKLQKLITHPRVQKYHFFNKYCYFPNRISRICLPTYLPILGTRHEDTFI